MATIEELLKEIDWDLYDESDNAPEEGIDLENMSVEEIIGAAPNPSAPASQKRAELIIHSRMNIAARAKLIRREAVDNNDDLTALISRKQLNELIRLITIPDTEKIDRYLYLINMHATQALSPFIPVDLVRAYNKYKKINSVSIPRAVGFIYKAPPEWGYHYDMWLTPDIPQYLTQFTEPELIARYKPEKKDLIDNNIVRYHRMVQYRAKLEMSLARRLYSIVTRYDLLVKNADFYKIYMTNKLYEL